MRDPSVSASIGDDVGVIRIHEVHDLAGKTHFCLHVVVVLDGYLASLGKVLGVNLSTNIGVSGSVGSEQFANVSGEIDSRAILAASGIAEELHDGSLLSSCVLPQIETAGKISNELETA